MLRAEPKNLWSSTYRLSGAGADGLELRLGWWHEEAHLELEGRTYELGREGWMSGEFYLHQGRERIATAEKPSALRRRFEITCDGRRFVLEPAGWGRTLVLTEAGVGRVGEVAPESWLGMRLRADLPEDLPLPVRIFVLWLTLVVWRRQKRSA